MKTILSVILLLGAQQGADEPPVIRWTEPRDGLPGTLEVAGIDGGILTRLATAGWDFERWTKLFSVHVIQEGQDNGARPPVLGAYRVVDGLLRFEPQFPWAAGLHYRAQFQPMNLPGHAGKRQAPIARRFSIPKPSAKATTVVSQVYPSGDILPENHLRFYLHFSAPMRQGEAYQHIKLLDAEGKPVDQAFLALEEELWDREGKRFTLFLHPGRVKKGLQPREEFGPILTEGKMYTLEIGREWRDAAGAPLKETFRKRFRAGPAEEQCPKPKDWKISAPRADSRDPLTVRFPLSLDHALLHRMIWVLRADGSKVAGTIAVSEAETLWRFTPEGSWDGGEYQLVADRRLEDRAGNSIARPFEVDVVQPTDDEIRTDTSRIPFTVMPGRPSR
jgi:hypothetical protein